jgi:hypothetical protein
MIRVLVPLTLLAASACNYDKAPEGPPTPPPGKCVADGLGGFTGKTHTDAVEKDALRLSGSKSARWISPGMAVTMDFREDRLNFELDAQGKIVRAFCG